MATRRENLGVENGAAGGEWTLSSFLPSMAMSREGPAAEDDVVGGSSNQCINGRVDGGVEKGDWPIVTYT
jgi:hypothetical protein